MKSRLKSELKWQALWIIVITLLFQVITVAAIYLFATPTNLDKILIIAIFVGVLISVVCAIGRTVPHIPVILWMSALLVGIYIISSLIKNADVQNIPGILASAILSAMICSVLDARNLVGCRDIGNLLLFFIILVAPQICIAIIAAILIF
ncbi:MAG: hypothetical protein NTU85_00760 [Candidatus Kaiserbacteria bacterium]|nr:hypothetical protein [Candidatus Kaiserbacteria bacterium]